MRASKIRNAFLAAANLVLSFGAESQFLAERAKAQCPPSRIGLNSFCTKSQAELRREFQAVSYYYQAVRGPQAATPYTPAAMDAPSWFPVNQPGTPVNFQQYIYSPQYAYDNTETGFSTTELFGRPPYVLPFVFAYPYGQPVANEGPMGGCQIVDRTQDTPPVYFYDVNTQQHIGGTYPPSYPNAGPDDVVTSETVYGVRGMAINLYQWSSISSPGQSQPSNFAQAAAYVTGNNNPCAAADLEYGIFTLSAQVDPVTGGNPTYFYNSYWTNCNGYGGCRSNPNGWNASSPIYQVTSPMVEVTNPMTYEGTNTNLIYELFVIPVSQSRTISLAQSPSGYAFRGAVIDGNHPDRFATCNLNGVPLPVACTFDIPSVMSFQQMATLLTGGSNLVNAMAAPDPWPPGFTGGSILVSSLSLGH